MIYHDTVRPEQTVAVYVGSGAVALIVEKPRSHRVVLLTPESAEGLAADLMRHAAAFRSRQTQAVLPTIEDVAGTVDFTPRLSP